MNRILTAALALVAAPALSLLAAEPAPAPAAAVPGYGVTSRFALGGDGGWDYLAVDAASRRVFVSRSTHVMVVDADSGKVVGDIPGTDGVHGIALAPELKRGFTSNGLSSTVTVFDLATLKPTMQVKTTGENPDAILFEPFTGRVFTFNGRGKNATAIDAATGEVVGTVRLAGKPEFATSDEAGRVFVNIEDRKEVTAFDPKRLAIEAHWPLGPCEGPTGMALDRKKRRLYVGCSNSLLVVMSSADGRVLAKVPIGQGNDAVAFDADAGLVFASNGDGTLTVIRETAPGTFNAVQTVATKKGARTLALDTATHRLLLPAADFGPAPAPTAGNPHPRPAMVPHSFELLVVGTR